MDIDKSAYELRLFDRTLLSFRYSEGFVGLETHLVDVDDTAWNLMPFGLSVTDEGVFEWMQSRALPVNRRFAAELCRAMGLSVNDTAAIYRLGLGLSLNDSYWIVPEGFDGSFDEFNFYENGFSDALSAIAYCGHGADLEGNPEHGLSPDLTTSGNLPKGWRILDDGQRYLFKASTEGFAPGEPISEAVISEFARSIGIDCVRYALGEWKGKECSICPNFATKDVSYVPFAVATGCDSFLAAAKFYASLGTGDFEKFADMVALDAVVCNNDRHFTNFGILRDSHTGAVLSIAPVFDNGRGLFPNVSEPTIVDFTREAEMSLPALGAGATYVELVRRIIGPSQKEKLASFKGLDAALFPERYAERVRVCNEFLSRRIETMLECPTVDREALFEGLSAAKVRRHDRSGEVLRAQDLLSCEEVVPPRRLDNSSLASTFKFMVDAEKDRELQRGRDAAGGKDAPAR